MNLDPGAVAAVRQTARQFDHLSQGGDAVRFHKGTSKNAGLSVVRPRQNAHLPLKCTGDPCGRPFGRFANRPYIFAAGASLDFDVFRGSHKSKAENPENRSSEEAEKEEALRMAILAAFPDRVAKRRSVGDRELLLAKGGTARLLPSSVVDEPMFLVAVDIEEKKDVFPMAQAARTANIRLASAIEIEWLAEFFPEKLVETSELRWNAASCRVEESRRTLFEVIPLEEAVCPAKPSEETSRILADAVISRGIERLPDYEELETFCLRLNLLAETFPEDGWPRISLMDGVEIREYVYDMCRGRRSLDEIVSVSLKDILLEKLTEKQRVRLGREAPERVTLSAKRSVKINYEAGRPPWIESRLQDFFGMRETPRVCSGRVPLTLHLLAPNRRAVQVTQDLAGFWERHYPAIRRELMRRYPRHAWPESGA
jgi:ATP-dependent helicase HrpB